MLEISIKQFIKKTHRKNGEIKEKKLKYKKLNFLFENNVKECVW